MLIVSNAYSQHWVNKDTINIRGYVYDYVGKPVNKLLITSKQWDLEYNIYRISSVTDSSGYFELKGAKLNDTLTTEDHLLYDRITCLNRGSRFMMIYLPPPKHITTALSAPAAVTILHKRTQAKKAVSFKTKPFNETLCFFHVVAYPEYAKGKQAFEESLNRHIQYPVKALQHNVEGVVRITFTVQKDGVTSNFKIMSGLGFGCDTAVINAIKASGKWQPAMEDGRRYASNETIAVEFKLSDQ